MDEQQICRICANQCGAVRIPLCEANSVILSDINFVLKGHVEEISIADSLPKWVCQHCLQTLSSVVGFIRQAVETQNILSNPTVENGDESQPHPDEPHWNPVSASMEYDEIKIEDELGVDQNVGDDKEEENHENLFNHIEEELEDYYEPIENVEASYEDADLVEVSSDDGRAANLFQLVTVPKTPSVGDLICLNCNLQFSRSSELQSHMKEVHAQKNSAHVFCHLCKSKFLRQRLLRYHLKQRHGVFSCPTCDEMFTDSDSLAAHSRTHVEKDPFECRVCQKTFQRKTPYNLHISKQHPNLSEACDICDDQFFSREEMMSHRESHNSHKCPVCHDLLKSQLSLDRHIFHKHGSTSYACAQCEQIFSTKKELMDHSESHKSSTTNLDEVIKIEDDSE